MRPTTKYTKSGGINIAYQVFGSGAIDLVYLPGWISNIDWMWACLELVGFLEELGKVARVILFDKRGTGLSDRVVECSTLEERMDDIRAVMDTIGARKAVLLIIRRENFQLKIWNRFVHFSAGAVRHGINFKRNSKKRWLNFNFPN